MSSTPAWEHYGTHDDSAYPELFDGCLGAWAPGMQMAGGALHDFSGSGNILEIAAGASATYTAITGTGGVFIDGTNDEISLASPQRMAAISNAASVCCWVYPTSVPSGNNAGIIARWLGATSANRSLLIYLHNNTNYIGFSVSSDGSYQAEGDVVSSTAVPVNMWSCIGASFVGGVEISLYFNGASVYKKTSSIPAAVYNSGAKLAMGFQFYNAPSGGAVFYGGICSAMLYNKALSPEDFRLLASHPLIAYTPRRPRRFYSIPAAGFPFWAHPASSRVIGGGI